MKRCRRCGETKPYEAFYSHKGGRGGVDSLCKDCKRSQNVAFYWSNRDAERERIKRWKTTSPDAWALSKRKNNLKRRGVTPEMYEAMLVAQGGRCAVCGASEDETRYGVLCVDHDHGTGAVRGLLCEPCNQSLGLLREDPSRIQALADYLTGVRGRPGKRPVLDGG